MAFLTDNAMDSGLAYLTAHGANVYICSTEPTNYTEATSTYALGVKAGLTVGSPTNGTTGRKVVIPAITDGSVTGTGTAGFWALTDGSGELLAVKSLASTQGVTSGNTFTLPAINITIPDPT